MRAMMIMAGAAALAGCATTGRSPVAGVAGAGETIAYETSPCFGSCPVYAVTVRPDGTGTFEGRRFTAVSGAREFVVPADAYRRLVAALAPYRPAGERLIQPGSPECEGAPTDMPAVDVRWSGDGAARHLSFYGGCRRGNEALADALRGAPELLPIAAMIGPREPFRGQR